MIKDKSCLTSSPHLGREGSQRSKRETKRYPLDFYLDNERQSRIYDWLKSQENGKEAILQALEQVMEIKN